MYLGLQNKTKLSVVFLSRRGQTHNWTFEAGAGSKMTFFNCVRALPLSLTKRHNIRRRAFRKLTFLVPWTRTRLFHYFRNINFFATKTLPSFFSYSLCTQCFNDRNTYLLRSRAFLRKRAWPIASFKNFGNREKNYLTLTFSGLHDSDRLWSVTIHEHSANKLPSQHNLVELMMWLTEFPSYVQDDHFMGHICTSNGKYWTDMEQEDR